VRVFTHPRDATWARTSEFESMDATYFLKKRTSFIKYLYQEGSKPFAEIQERIQDARPPYDNPPYSEDPEPAYLEEWMDASTARDVLAMSCLSLLSDTLKLYLETLRSRVIGFSFTQPEKVFRDGFIPAYKAVLGEILETDWADCPSDLALIEQIVLARNRGQHGGSLQSLDVTHDPKTLQKHSRPFFVSEDEYHTWIASGGRPDSGLTPSIEVTPETLFAAIESVERLADWIDGRLDKAWAWRALAAAPRKDPE
jgi:hypothetical protein